MDPRIDDSIATCGGTPHTLAMPKTKEFITDVARSSVWVNRTPKRVNRTEMDGSTPGDTCIDVRSPQANSPVLTGGTTVSTSWGISGSLQVGNKMQSTSPDKIRDTPKLDASVDRNFPGDWYYASIFSKVIGCELSHGSSTDLCSRCRMDFAINVVQTKAPQFVDLGLPAVNTSNEFGIIGTPATSIIRPKDGSHWSVLDNFFGKATAVGMGAARSDQDYSYKTDFDIWRGNQDCGSQIF